MAFIIVGVACLFYTNVKQTKTQQTLFAVLVALSGATKTIMSYSLRIKVDSRLTVKSNVVHVYLEGQMICGKILKVEESPIRVSSKI